MTAVGFLSPELSRWDALAEQPGGAPELLALTFFADERPLRGAAGVADWRLCGRLSRLLAAGRIGGALGESTLLPGMRLPFARVLLFGVGDSDGFHEPRFREAVRALRRVLRELKTARAAVLLPGRATGLIVARRALELWLEDDDRGPEVLLIEPPAAQKEMSERLGKPPPRR